MNDKYDFLLYSQYCYYRFTIQIPVVRAGVCNLATYSGLGLKNIIFIIFSLFFLVR